ncbi:MAG TPA: hemolysin III family protein [Ramlibacter sp.]|nr:hemolysin III family protein [Ramlibacter sp.]
MAQVQSRSQSHSEELANALSHGFGAVLAAAFSPQLIDRALEAGTVHGAAAAIFCVSMVLLFSVSAAYHWAPAGATKDMLRRWDHAAIFLFIAGSYTPFMLGSVADAGGRWVLAVVWTIAAFGMIAKCVNRLTHPILSTSLYLALGWISVVILDPLISNTPPAGVVLLVAGGVLYTLGAIVFHLDERFRYAHFVWHLLVLSASACHFFAVLNYAVV